MEEKENEEEEDKEKEKHSTTKTKLDFRSVDEKDIHLKDADKETDEHVVDMEKTITNDTSHKDGTHSDKSVKEVGRRRRRGKRRGEEEEESEGLICCGGRCRCHCTIV